MNSSFPSTFFPLPAASNRARARGFSLLEVAIALVIFVFGALAIVRIFPGALRIISVGGSRQNALNLNRATMARVQNAPPYATYDVGQTGGGWQDGYPGDTSVVPNIPPEPRAVLGSTRRGYSLPRTSNLQDYDVSALATVRQIVGEPMAVKQDTGGNKFIFTQFPIYDGSTVVVSEKSSLSGVTINGLGTLDFSNARWVNTGDDFAPIAGDTYTYHVTFRYQDNGQIWGVVDFPTRTGIIVAPYQTSVASNTIIAGQVDVVCLHQLGTIPTSPTNDDARGFVSLTGVNGSVTSNGSSHTVSAQNPADQVFVDYQADWGRILQEGNPNIVPEDPSAPANARQIPLAAPFIEDHATDAVLTDLYTDAGNTFTITPDAWGEGVTPTNNLRIPTPSDLRASRVTFDMGTDLNKIARVSYRTRDQWTQQLSVAAAAYKPFTDGLAEPWRDYYLDGSSNASVLFFHSSESGKSVMITYSYTDGTNTFTLRNRLLTISDDGERPGILPAGFNPTPTGYAANPKYASRLDLKDTSDDPLLPPNSATLPSATNPKLLSISSVRGASVTVRTAWLDGSRYTQSCLTAMRAGTGAEAMP